MNLTKTKTYLAIALCMATVGNAVAGGIPQLPISVSFKNTPLKSALINVQNKSGVKLAFQQKLVAKAKPVTLTCANTETKEILRRLLRPQGLVAVWTSPKLIAIVPATTQTGTFKYFGESIRRGVQLCRKLEEATFDGTSLKVPGWTDDDDHAAAEVALDIAALTAYAQNGIGQFDADAFAEIKDDLTSFDPDVRAGTFMTCIDHKSKVPMDDLKRLLNDEDPFVTAVWLLVRGNHYAQEIEDKDAFIKPVVESDDPMIRVAALISLHRKVAPKLVADENAVVQFFANLMLYGSRSARSNDQFERMLASKNPILKTFACMMAIDSRDAKTRLLGILEKSADPMLKQLKPYMKGLGLTEQAEVKAHVGRMIDGLADKNRTTRVLSTCGLFLTYGANRNARRQVMQILADPNGKALKTVAAWNNDKNYWFRTVGLCLSGASPMLEKMLTPELSAQLKKRFARALASDDELVRLPALYVTFVQAQTGMPLDEKAKAAVVRSFKLPAVTDQVAAGMTLGSPRAFDFDLALKTMAAHPKQVFGLTAGSKWMVQQIRRRSSEKIVDQVATANIPTLKMAFAERSNRMDREVTNRFISKNTNLEVILAVAQKQRFSSWGPYAHSLSRALDGDDPERLTKIARILNTVMFKSINRDRKGDKKVTKTTLEQVVQRLFLHAKDSKDADSWADELCVNLVQANLLGAPGSSYSPYNLKSNPNHLKGPVEDRILDLLSQWNDPKRAAAAVKLINVLSRFDYEKSFKRYYGNKNPITPAVARKLEQQRQLFFKKGNPKQIGQLLLSQSKTADWTDTQAKKLEAIVLKNGVPISKDVMTALAKNGRLPNPRLRGMIVNSELLDSKKLESLLTVPQWSTFTAEFALEGAPDGKVTYSDTLALREVLPRKEIDPEMRSRAKATLLSIAKSASGTPTPAQNNSASCLYSLYVRKVEGFSDLKTDLERFAAYGSPLARETIRFLPSINSKTTVFKEYLENYEKLTPKIKEQLLETIGKLPDAPKSRELLIRILKDQKENPDTHPYAAFLPFEKDFRHEEDPELRAALEAVKHRRYASNALRFLNARKKKHEESTQSLLRFDTNGDGKLDDQETHKAANAMLKRIENRGLRGEWKAYDLNRNGMLDKKERKEALKAMIKKIRK